MSGFSTYVPLPEVGTSTAGKSIKVGLEIQEI